MDARLRDQADFPAALEKRACHILVDAVGDRRQIATCARLLDHTCPVDEVGFVRAASDLAVELLEIYSAKRYIIAEHCIDDGIVVLNDCNHIFEAAEWLVRIEVWTCLHEVVAREHVVELPRLKVNSAWWIDFIRLCAGHRWRFLRPLIGRRLDSLPDACLH